MRFAALLLGALACGHSPVTKSSPTAAVVTDGASATAANHRQATVTGTAGDEFVAVDGAAGTSGAVWVLRDCKYDLP